MSAAEAPEDRLYALLPAIYRRRDIEQGQTLRALMRLLQEQLDRVHADIAQLYDNWFIETCDDWVVPYIGDLLAVQLPHPFAAEGLSLRAFIANTLGFRRRKGTAGMLERVAQDVSGLPAAAVEYFERLATTQNVKHVRSGALGTANLRDRIALERIQGPFERLPYTAEMRSIASGRGRYNLPSVGLFLWSLRSLKADRAVAAPAPDVPSGESGFFRVDPLGQDLQLWQPRDSAASLDLRQSEAQVPQPLRRSALAKLLTDIRTTKVREPQALAEAAAEFDALLRIELAGAVVPAERIVVCDLTTWHRPAATTTVKDALGNSVTLPVALALDPVTGRIALPTAANPTLLASYYYGAPGELGGGAYARAASDVGFEGARVIQIPAGAAPQTLSDALDAWSAATHSGVNHVVFEVQDNRNYQLANLTLPADAHVAIRAARGGPERPLLLAPAADGRWEITLGAGANLTLEGVWVAATLRVSADFSVVESAQLNVNHATLVPGVTRTPLGAAASAQPSIEVLDDRDVQLALAHCISGPVIAPPGTGSVSVEDSVLDASGPDELALAGSQLTLQRTTLLGTSRAAELKLAEDSIFSEGLIVERSQSGCARFSFVPPGSSTPRQFHCQPKTLADAGSARARNLRPQFASLRFGVADYARLAAASPAEITTGGSDHSEMGAYQSQQVPRRMANLQAALREYVRFGLEVGLLPTPLRSL